MEKLQDMGHSMIAARGERTPAISGQLFEDQEIVLDSKHFVRCAFKNCAIKINGDQPFGLSECTFDRCKFIFAGSVQVTLQVLAMMYHNGFRQVIEDVFESVRQALPPDIPWTQSRLPEN